MKLGTLKRKQQRLRRSKLNRTGMETLEVRAHHLLCAICVKGGCEDPPAGRRKIVRLLKDLWRYLYLQLKITADLDLNRAYYLDVYAGRRQKPLPINYLKRHTDFVGRRKDLETIRRIGIVPNTVLPAYLEEIQ